MHYSLKLLVGSTLALTCLWILTPSRPVQGTEGKEQKPEEFYEKEVLPILQANCLACHGGEKKIKGGLNLTTREELFRGGDTGPGFDEKKPLESLLLQVVNYSGDIQMPPKGKLSQKQIDTLTEWVKKGVPYSDKKEAAVGHGPPKVDETARNFWAFKPVRAVEIPKVKDAAWVRNPVDAFILSKLEAKNFKPAPPTDKVVLLKRVYYALTGLPPRLRDVEKFLADKSPDAYEKVVDSLLGSRHFGENWARHWMDLVRYAETNSFERDGPKAFAWKYRDYLIRSFNEDKPYDQFIKEQIAGDELDKVTRDSAIATGFIRLGLWDDEPADHDLAYYDQLDDIVSTTGQTFLGLTVGCARCHDHKIDPFPQKDYYAFLAFFHGVNSYGYGDAGIRQFLNGKMLPPPPEARKNKKKGETDLADVNKQIAALEAKVESQLVAGEKDDFKHEGNRANIVAKYVGKHITAEENKKYLELRKKREEINAAPPDAGEPIMAVVERGRDPRETFILVRGLPLAKGDKVEPGFPTVLTGEKAVLPKMPLDAKTSGRRKVLANWIASPTNPLTARVMANRLFQFTFGRGLVRSANNFGYQGTPPTHPELLDWLAGELVKNQWHLKPVLKTIVTSNAFRMSYANNPEAITKDPENELFWRFDLRRLSAEEIRDSILAISGNLNLDKTEGPSVYPLLSKEVLAGQSVPGSGWGRSSEKDQASRSVYVYIKRSLAVPLLAVFDSPDPDTPCPVRFTTTQPSQALGMINGSFLNEEARKFALLIQNEVGEKTPDRVRAALKRALLRSPTDKEIQRGLKLIESFEKEDRLSADEAFRRFCLMVLNLNEVLFLN